MKPAQVTKAHHQLAFEVYSTAQRSNGFRNCAQLIADSEARAVERHTPSKNTDWINRALVSEAERDQLRADFADFKKRTWEHDEYNARVMSERSIERDKLLDELAKERARHTALRKAVFDVLCDPEGKACFHGTDADRAAIDAAMKEDTP